VGKEQSGRAIALERDVIQKKIDELGKEAQELLTFLRESGGKAGTTVSDLLAELELASALCTRPTAALRPRRRSSSSTRLRPRKRQPNEPRHRDHRL
jgi:hypothetical protein